MKKVFISMCGLIVYFIIFSQVQAAGSVSLSTNKSAVSVGDTFNVSVNIKGASIATLTVKLNIDTQKVEYVSGPSNSNYSNGKIIYTWTDPNGGASPITNGTIATFSFKAKAEGSSYFGVSGDFYTPEETSANPSLSGVSVMVNKIENNNNVNTTPNQTPNQTPSQTPSQAQSQTPSQTPTQTPTQTSPNTSSSTNNINNSQKNNLSSNNFLKILQLDIEGINPVFNKKEKQYYITVPEDVNNINITAQPEDTKSKIKISGNTNLQIGLNQIKILVTAENGDAQEYVINVTKTNNLELANANLENLAIENFTLNPEFMPDVTEYIVDIQGDIEKLNILAIPQKENAKVTIDGNENLQYGENIVKINVLAEDGQTSKIYNITVKKSETILENENLENNTAMEAIDKNVEKSNIVITICLLIVGSLSIAGIVIFVRKKYNR